MLPIATAIRDTFRHGYGLPECKADASAAFVVSMVALPLSMALSIAVGLPPQHGIYTAIVAGIIAAVLGGSMQQVSGPTGAFVVILAPIAAVHGVRGLTIAGFMAGVLLLVLGFSRLGRFIKHVPQAVTVGFTAGIALVLATLSLSDMLGLGVPLTKGHYTDKLEILIAALPNGHWRDIAVSALTLLLLLYWPKFTKKLPSPFVAILVAGGAGWLLMRMGFPVATLDSRFHILEAGGDVFLPLLHLPAMPDMAELTVLFTPALVIAALAALESLLSATVADSLAGTHHDPDAELVGIGAANIATALVGGLAATGAVARTATNVRAGAVSPLAAVMHALLLLAYVSLFVSLIAHIPMAALSTILFLAAWHMSHHRHFLGVLKNAENDEKITMLGTFLLTVLLDMVAGVAAGVALAFLFHQMKRTRGKTSP